MGLSWRGVPPLLLLAVGASSAGAPLSVTLVPSVPSDQPVGTVVVWSASVDPPEPLAAYRFEARPAGGDWRVVRDFGRWSSFEWTSLEEGPHEVRVQAVDLVSGGTAAQALPFAFTSRLKDATPGAFPTAHPLVALYSAPPCIA